ncbi:MAG: ABC transporter permease [Alistipes sp.]|nr:ABC transporter permease [Alistipes sp.]
MKIKDIISTDYFKLFVKREGRVVLGKHYSSLWLLCSVLTATFLAIAFSNASLDYLSYKMNDPFINWVDIPNSFGADEFRGFEQALQNDENKEKFHYRNHQTDKYWYMLYYNSNKESVNLRQRFFAEISSPLVQAIMDEENVVGGNCIESSLIDNTSYGVIITSDALHNKLGYKDVPAFIYYKAHIDSEASYYGVDFLTEGMDGYEDIHFAMVPVPVLAVVERLPSNMDIIGTKFFYQQNLERAFNLSEPSYFSSLIYYVPENVDADKFKKDLDEISKSMTEASIYMMDDLELPRMVGCKEGQFVALFYDYEDEVDFEINKQINNKLLDTYESDGVCRIYRYLEYEPHDDDDNYISVHFADLDMISAFQEFAKSQYNIDIEMSQISAKENFNEVSIMANILSWTMIVFAIVCIILFIVNLLQSYFQKVKRNLGTFKAFGIGNYELILVYVLIMMATICVSIVMSLAVAYFIQEFLSIVGIQKDGMFDYLSLWSSKTFWAVLVIINASIYTVYVVMRNLLKDTPGNLIYDR